MGDLANVFFWMGAFASGLFVIKMLLMLGGGDADSDVDVDTDVDLDSDAEHPDSSGSFTLLSVQSFLAFFMGMGWTGWGTAGEMQMGTAAAVAISGAVGFAFMVIFAFLFAQLKRLDDPKKLNLWHSVGTHGRAYMKIPAKGEGRGKVELTVDGRRMVIAASSTSGEIDSFADVTVVSVDDDDSLVVSPRA